MASTVGMIVRTSKANERIDVALAALAAGSDAPARPNAVRDSMLRDVMRLEWVADTLEVLSGSGEPKALPVELDGKTFVDANGKPLTVSKGEDD